MRNLIFISVFIFSVCGACNKNKDNVEDTGVVEEVVLGNDNMDEVQPNPSDVSFIIALEEYQEGNYENAADHIENGIINLREEEKSVEMVNGRLLDGAIVKLRSLEDKVRAHDIKDTNVLSKAITNAEMLVAHDYMIYTINSLTEKPSKSVYYFDKAMESLDRTIPKLPVNTREEAVQIRNESIKIAEKLKSGSTDVRKDLQKQTKKIESFLQNHANEMM